VSEISSFFILLSGVQVLTCKIMFFTTSLHSKQVARISPKYMEFTCNLGRRRAGVEGKLERVERLIK